MKIAVSFSGGHAHDFDPELDIGGSCGDSCEAFVGDGNEDAVFVDIELSEIPA
jgi:hypothetical protein